ncbi:MAG: AbrB/MazE/SpoVT family DNA-binding domain-containing protein [Nitrososphaeraceae archaeon]
MYLVIYSHDCKKNFGHCRVLKGGRFTIPKEVREKMSIKDGDFVDFLVTIYGSIKIIKFKFDWKRQ